jgi:ubiquinone/menaquinone biosynthesis C-methylase UbiE
LWLGGQIAESRRTVHPTGEGIDFKAPELRTAKPSTRQVTLTDALPCRDDCFAIVTMLAVLEHLSHPREMVGEIARVLKPGGAFSN